MRQPAAITIVVVLLVIVRFLIRELRERQLSQAQLFVLPGIVWTLAILYAGSLVVSFPARAPELALESAVAVVAGILIGFAVARFTTVRTAQDGRIFFRGSYATVAIWVVALLLRVGARFAIANSAPKGASIVANAALVVLLATALTAMRVLVRRKALSERARGTTLAETAL